MEILTVAAYDMVNARDLFVDLKNTSCKEKERRESSHSKQLGWAGLGQAQARCSIQVFPMAGPERFPRHTNRGLDQK